MDRITLESDKQALLSDTFEPNQAVISEFKGRENELRMVFAAWMGSRRRPPLCPLMVGEPGVGKNRIVYELAAITGLPLYILQGHEDLTAEDLACSVRFADDVRHRIDYVLSPLVTAMYKGGICFIDEIGKIRPRALSLLVSVLDERRYIDSTLLGERIAAAPTFRFVAATNTGEEHDLPEFIRSRMKPLIHIGFPSKDEITDIIASQAGVSRHYEALLAAFWNLWTARSLGPTPRDVVQLFALAASLCAYRNAGGALLHTRHSGSRYDDARNAALRGSLTAPEIEVEDLQAAFDDLFHQGAT
jgi:MoxR-like ATPase